MNFKPNAAKALLGAAIVAGAVTAIAQPARAISFNTSAGPNQPTRFSDASVANFQSAPTNVNKAYTEGTGTSAINFATTAQGPAKLDINTSNLGGQSALNKYLTIGNNNPVTVTFGEVVPLARGYFGLFVLPSTVSGTINFFRGISPTSVGGFSFTDPASGYYNFFGDNYNDLFDRVVITASSGSFNIDNVAARANIPTPALLPGLLGMGIAAWRKRKGEAVDQAEA